VGTGVAVPPAAAWIVAALRHRQAGVDLVALLSLVARWRCASTSPAR
jgi:hypothetical protein